LIYFHVTTKQQTRRGSIPERTTGSSTDSTPPFRQWGSFRRSFSRLRSSAASTDPITTVVARAAQEEELQVFEEEKPVLEQIDRDEASEESPIPSDLSDPITTVVARAVQEEELQDSEEEIPVVEQPDRNGASGESPIPSDPTTTVVARAVQEEELQVFEEEKPV
jgi:hypothetical protein